MQFQINYKNKNHRIRVKFVNLEIYYLKIKTRKNYFKFQFLYFESNFILKTDKRMKGMLTMN
jgi:hypothetical protein